MSDWGPSAGEAFATGFAQGFSDTYGTLSAQKRKEDADLVKFNMERFVREEEKFKAAEQADAKKVDAAKKFATANGLPEKAWGNLYNDFNMGITANQIQAKIDNGAYTKIDTKTSNVAMQVDDLSSVDARTSNQTENLLKTDTERKDKPEDVKVPGQSLFEKVSGTVSDLFDKEKRQEKREERVLESTLSKLDLDQADYDRILNGYSSVSPEISYVYSAKKDPSKAPKWKSLGNVTKANYLSFAAEARANKDEDQAIAIETLGASIDSANPVYSDFATMTDANAPGRLLAAQSANKPLVADKIESFILNNTDPSKGPKHKDWATLTVSNSRGRLIAAQRAKDPDSVSQIMEYILEKDDAFPDKIDKDWITSQYSKFAIAAARPDATSDDKAAFQNFKQLELPAYMEAYKLLNPDDALDFEQAFNEYYRLSNDPEADPEKTAEALKVANGAIIGMSIQQQIKENAGKPLALVKVGLNGDASFITSAQTVITAGGTSYVDGMGDPVGEGFRILGKDEDEAREKVVNALSTRVKGYDNNFVTATGAVRLLGELSNMVIDDPNVLLSTAGFAKGLSNLNKELTLGVKIIGDLFESTYGEGVSEDSVVTQAMVERRLVRQGVLAEGQTLTDLAKTPTINLGDSIEDLAKKKSAFNAKLILTAFRAGGLEGQTGMAMSNKDFDRLKDVVAASKDGPTFVAELSGYIQGRIDTLNDDASLLQQDRGRLNYQGRYGYDPFMGKSPVKEWGTLTAEDAEPMDERFLRGVDILNGDYTFDKEKTPTFDAVTAGAVEFMKNSVGSAGYEQNKKFFITKFGQSAFDALALGANQ